MSIARPCTQVTDLWKHAHLPITDPGKNTKTKAIKAVHVVPIESKDRNKSDSFIKLTMVMPGTRLDPRRRKNVLNSQ